VKNNKALMYVVSVLSATFLYSITFFFIPLKKMGEICILNVPGPGGNPVCAVNFSLIFLGVYMFIPLIVSVILQKLVYKEPLKEIGFKFKWSPWYLFAVFTPIAISFLSSASALIFPWISFTPDMSGMIDRYKDMLSPEQIAEMQKQLAEAGPSVLIMSIVQMIVAAVTINAVFALGEEAGWRGFFLKNLQSMPFYKKSALIGAVWGFWHLPVIIQGYNYPQHPIAGVFMMIIFCVLYSPIFTYTVEKTGSVFSAAVLHGAINASAGAAVMYIKGGSDLTAGVMAASGFIVLILANTILYFYDRIFSKEKIITKA